MKEYKYICKLCKKHPTSEENQLCSECRNKKMGDTQRCIICGNMHTAAPDGICYKCRRAHPIDLADSVAFLRGTSVRLGLAWTVWRAWAVGRSYEELLEKTAPLEVEYMHLISDTVSMLEFGMAIDRIIN